MKHSTASPAGTEPQWSVFPELVPAEAARVPLVRPTKKSPELVRVSDLTPITAGHVKATTLSFSNMHEHGDLLASFLRARKKAFIDGLHWDLPQTEGMEFDQYDTPLSRWVVVHEFGEILGGLRLTPTTAKCGVYSYMLRDAQLGMLERIPTDVLFFPAPVHEKVWEGTRLFISDAVAAERRGKIQRILMGQLLQSADELGATHILGFVPSVWYRWTKRMGLNAVAAGPKITIDGMVSQAALMKVSDFVDNGAVFVTH